jgi:hypothetical protein
MNDRGDGAMKWQGEAWQEIVVDGKKSKRGVIRAWSIKIAHD